MNTRASNQQASVAQYENYWSIFYCVAVATVFLLAAYERFRLPAAPLCDPDVWGYLGPAVLKLAGAGFHHIEGRNFLYPSFLLVVLGLTRNFAAITIAQHLLGLATGAVMICCWAKTKRFIRHISPRTHQICGVALTAIYLLSRHPVEYEHLLRPEAITPFFALLNILLTLQFFEMRWRRSPSRSGAAVAGLLLVNSILLAMLKTTFVLAVPFSAVPVLMALFDRRETWPRRTAIIGVTVIAAAAVLRTEQVLARPDPVARSFLPTSLFTIHARLIARQMDEDIAAGECGSEGCDWLSEVNASLHEEIEKSRHFKRSWKSLGFYPDYLMYEYSIQTWCDRFFDGDIDKQLDFESSYYLRALRMHPGRMIGKVLQEMAQFYLGYKQSFLATPQVKLAPRYAFTSRELQPYSLSVNSYPPFSAYLAELKHLSTSEDTLDQPVLITAVGALFCFLYPVVFFSTLGTACFLPRSLRRSYSSFAIVALFVFSYNFGTCLGIAIIHSLDVTRYIVAQYAFALLSEAIGLLFLFEIGLATRERPVPHLRPNDLPSAIA